MNHCEIQDIAYDHDLGEVRFEWRTALNTGEKFEAGYVIQNDNRVLFCKKSSLSDGFYLCNEFRKFTEQK